MHRLGEEAVMVPFQALEAVTFPSRRRQMARVHSHPCWLLVIKCQTSLGGVPFPYLRNRHFVVKLHSLMPSCVVWSNVNTPRCTVSRLGLGHH